jgi:hypothetical protein
MINLSNLNIIFQRTTRSRFKKFDTCVAESSLHMLIFLQRVICKYISIFFQEISVGIAAGYELDGPGLTPGSVKCFSSSQRPGPGPNSLPSTGYREILPRG